MALGVLCHGKWDRLRRKRFGGRLALTETAHLQRFYNLPLPWDEQL